MSVRGAMTHRATLVRDVAGAPNPFGGPGAITTATIDADLPCSAQELTESLITSETVYATLARWKVRVPKHTDIRFRDRLRGLTEDVTISLEVETVVDRRTHVVAECRESAMRDA